MELNLETIDKSHGSPWDRGAADSWYSRPRRPHKWLEDDEEKLTNPTEIAEYLAGYEDNENSGGKKEWD